MATFEEFLAPFPEDVQEVALALRGLVTKAFPGAVEEHDAENYGFGFAKGYKASVFVISPAKSYVRLGFAYASKLPDPKKLLGGAGRVHKHIKVATVEDAKAPALAALVKAQLEARKAAVAVKESK